MIRRRSGRQYWLITQQEHAAVAAEFARVWGSDPDGLYTAPADRERFVRAVAHHDDGWAEVDAAGTLNAAHRPLDVFDEKPAALTHQVWLNSAERAAAIDPWAGLLVSLHFSTLGDPPQDPAQRLEYAQYEQAQIDLRQRLRPECGLRTDISTHHGLAIGEAADDPLEQQLLFEFRLLRACDLLSLCICKAGLMAEHVGPLPRKPGGASLAIALARHQWSRNTNEAGEMSVHPWPFGVETLSINVPYRPVPIGNYASTDELREAMQAAEPASFRVSVHPRGPTATERPLAL